MQSAVSQQDVRRLETHEKETKAPADYLAAAVLTQHTPSGAWFPVLRPYTPISDPEVRGEIQFIVKRYPKGKASSYMHSLAPGQTLQVRGPIPGYSYTPSEKSRDLLLVAGGAGITPIYSLARGILKDPDDQTRIQLLWGVNGTRDIVLRDELEQLEKQHPDRLQVTCRLQPCVFIPV